MIVNVKNIKIIITDVDDEVRTELSAKIGKFNDRFILSYNSVFHDADNQEIIELTVVASDNVINDLLVKMNESDIVFFIAS